MIFDPDFKKAIQSLSSEEKDKLLFRLLKRDLQLVNKLRFELIDTDSVEDKRQRLEEKIVKRLMSSHHRYYSASYLLMDLRDISGEINDHVYITKDKFGEISLNCKMIRKILELNNQNIRNEKPGQVYTVCIYIVARMFKILMLIQKQHEDLHLEFREDIEAIGKYMFDNHNIMKVSINNGFDIVWLLKFIIPENLPDIYKDLRKNGFLR